MVVVMIVSQGTACVLERNGHHVFLFALAHQYISIVTPHNHFLNVMVYFGIPGIILLGWFFLKLLKNGIKMYKESNNLFYKSIGIGLIAYLAGYIINASFHNAGPMRGDKCWWYVVAIVLAAYNLNYLKVKSEKSNR